MILTLLLLAPVWPYLPYHSDDSASYLRMAAREEVVVPRPFALRVVHTGAAGILWRVLGLGLDTAFIVVALLSCWLLITSTAWAQRRSGAQAIVTALTVLTWYSFTLLRDATLPDMFNAGMIAACLVTMSRRPWWALVLLAIATLGRETTMLLALVIAVLAWRGGRRRYGLAAVVVGAACLIALDLMTAGANVHGIGTPLYLAAKVPFNLARNLFGCELWVNTIPYCRPRWAWELPDVLKLGAVHSVGFCGFNAVRPLTLFTAWLGNFGIMPALLWSRWGEVRAAWRQAPLWLRAALVYGLTLFFLAPAAGAHLPRLVGYGWPAFWLALPLLTQIVPLHSRERWLLAGLHVMAAWGAPLLRSSQPVALPWLGAAFILALACNLGAARIGRMPNRPR